MIVNFFDDGDERAWIIFFPSMPTDRPNSFSSCKAHIGNRDSMALGTPPVPDIRRTRIAASADTLEKREKRLDLI